MAVRIRSLVTTGPVLVPLATGTTVRLSPGQASDELPDVEVADNAKVDKLRQRGVIDVETADGSAETPEPAQATTDDVVRDAAAPDDADGEPRTEFSG